jgi:hypothetical protein
MKPPGFKFLFPKNRVAPPGKLRVEKWYDRQTRSWVIQTKDSSGNQVGEATYVHSKREANIELRARGRAKWVMTAARRAYYDSKKKRT